MEAVYFQMRLVFRKFKEFEHFIELLVDSKHKGELLNDNFYLETRFFWHCHEGHPFLEGEDYLLEVVFA